MCGLLCILSKQMHDYNILEINFTIRVYLVFLNVFPGTIGIIGKDVRILHSHSLTYVHI
jgi:hypothetical protein